MTLGEKISYYRKQNNYSQEKIAEVIGVSRQAVTKWESNQSAPSTENLIKLANLYKISLDDLTNINLSSLTIDKKPTDNKKIKKISILWMIVFIILNVFFIFTHNGWLWLLINLMIIFSILTVVIYLITLLIRALLKYIHS